MPFSKRKIESALKRKGFVEDNRSHKYFVYITTDGVETGITTFTSHGPSGKDISNELFAQMAKQCILTKRDFENFVNCPLKQKAYETILIEGGHIPPKATN